MSWDNLTDNEKGGLKTLTVLTLMAVAMLLFIGKCKAENEDSLKQAYKEQAKLYEYCLQSNSEDKYGCYLKHGSYAEKISDKLELNWEDHGKEVIKKAPNRL